MKQEISIWWLRRDLRIEDNSSLFYALKSGVPVLPVFIFNEDNFPDFPAEDKRLIFIWNEIKKLKLLLESEGSGIWVQSGNPVAIFMELFEQFEVKGVYTGVDYEPHSIYIDQIIRKLCIARDSRFHPFPDHLIFDPADINKPNGQPYTIFTPYSRVWLHRYSTCAVDYFPSEKFLKHLVMRETMDFPFPELPDYNQAEVVFPGSLFDEGKILNYHLTRDFPALEGTTRLGVHLRYGTISVRKLAATARDLNPVFLKELIWREFYQMILFHYPEVVTRSFRPAYDRLTWLNRQEDFDAWCAGRTGYPMVDAGMRQLVQTGYMHNRVRMITASFLTKHLLIDWRWGEAFFAQYLLDYELASNNGGWQWAAGSGCDAVPYFRVFSPQRQQEKFDPGQIYIREWLPEYSTAEDYLKPIVDHATARARAIDFLRKAR